MISDVKSGGEVYNPNSPPCEFGPFGIIMNESGDCSKPCPKDQSPVQVNYGGQDICCCN